MPKRIQRRRTPGWLMPPGAVYVGRPSRYGNPFPTSNFGQDQAVQLYREWLAGADHLGYADAADRRQAILDGLPALAGRDLACWCDPEWACHADVLLALANPRPVRSTLVEPVTASQMAAAGLPWGADAAAAGLVQGGTD